MKQSESIHARVRCYAQATPEQIMQQLETSAAGLSGKQILLHRQKFGSNAPAANRHGRLLHCLGRALLNPFSIVLFVLGVICLVTDLAAPGLYGQSLSSVMILFVMLLLGAGVRLWQELRARHLAQQLTRLSHSTVAVCRQGEWYNLDAAELVVGDIVRLEAGDRVPADIRLIAAEALQVSQSVITGESGSWPKDAAPLKTPPERLGQFRNTVFCGCTVTGGRGTGVVLAVGSDTVYGAPSGPAAAEKQGFDQGANDIARVLIRFMLLLVPVVFLASGLTRGNWWQALLFALSVAVGLTPELLPMVINACLTRGSAQMWKRQTIVKNINAMQGFGSMDILCVDKTGTLTGDAVLLEYYTDILGNESQTVLHYAYLSSALRRADGNQLDAAILKCSQMPGREAEFQALRQQYRRLDELPFDPERKLAATLLDGPQGPLLLVQGSVKAVLARCSRAVWRESTIDIGPDALQSVHSVVDEMTEDGMKVLAVACKSGAGQHIDPDESDLTLVGYLAFFDAPKQSAASAVAQLQKQRVDVRVLTGDALETTRSVCRRLGMPVQEILTGADLDAMAPDEQLLRIEQTRIFAELSPKQKATIVQTLRESGHTVGYLGDGMNDLPAIRAADVGIGVDTAAQAVQEQADVLLLKKDLNVLGAGIRTGRQAFCNMSKYIKITASSNFGNICAVVIASVLLPFFPMTSVQLLLLNLLYDLLCLSLPWDHVDKAWLEKPLEWSGRGLGRFMTYFGPISTVFDVITFLFLYFLLCPAVCGGSFHALDAAGQAQFIALFQTGWFLESLWTQVLILHLLRSASFPFIGSRPAAPVLAVTLCGVLLLTGLPFTALGGALGLTVMPAGYFGFLAAAVVGYLLCVSAAKARYLRKYRELI